MLERFHRFGQKTSRSDPAGPNRSRYLKQTLLFLVTVLMPSTALVLLSARMIVQERELASNRSRERREQIGRDFGGSLAKVLNDLRAAAEQAREFHAMPTEGAFVAFLEQDRLICPWDRKPAGLASDSETAGAEHILAGQKAEFEAGELARALARYQAALDQSARPARQASARLAAARVLSKMGSPAEADSHLGAVLGFPLDTQDEFGVPMAFYAVGRRLGDRRTAGVIEVIERGVQHAPGFSPAALYMLRDYLEQLREQAGPDHAAALGQYLDQLKPVLRRNERWAELLAVFGNVPRDLARDLEKPEFRKTWRLHETPEIGLLSAFKMGDPNSKGIILVDPRHAVAPILKDPAFALFQRVPPRLASGTDPQGVGMGGDFPNMQVVLPPEVFAALSNRPQPGLYLSLIVLVVGLTLYAGYLWFRDTRRELSLARLRSDFVASVSHELKTPLTSIQMLTETLRKRELAARERSEYLDLIFGETQRLGRLLKNVLDFSQVEQGTKSYHLRPVDLRELVEIARRAAEQPMQQQRIQFLVRNELDASILADADSVEQAILNLLYNAIKYSPEGSRIELETRPAGTNVAILIRDGGIGIHPRDHLRIFERFYRVPEEHNRRIPGTGLGLALVKHIAEGHGGAVTVQSAPGQGSTFTLFLPLAQRA